MTIVIVDDSLTMLMSLKTGLTLSGFKVVEANWAVRLLWTN